MTTTIASAPGKVLLTGGYLVLEQAFDGLVVGTSARFYTVIRPQSLAGTITVGSPQFEQAQWSYKANINTSDQLDFLPSTESRNKFVETCLKFSLLLILEKIGSRLLSNQLEQGIHITIVGDNDFYSQRAQLQAKHLDNTAESLQSLDPFCSTHATLSTVHKTGLGSSAALTTSLVAALLLHFGVVQKALDRSEKTLIHNLAQFVHCLAQGKVGSGFDVSSAVWGSHRYKRFNPSILTPLMDENVDPKVLCQALDANNKDWDNKVTPFQLPPGFDLILADIDAGSHTPTLVGKVLAWKKSKPEESEKVWTELGRYNSLVEQHFRDLSTLYEQDPSAYNKTIETCSSLRSKEWSEQVSGPVAKALVDLVQDFNQVRHYLQKMTELSGVPVEPKEQTKLLDACSDIPGVLMSGVPGAGGYDAIFCIVLSDIAKENVRELWATWNELSVGPLLSHADSNGVTSVTISSVPGLSRVLS